MKGTGFMRNLYKENRKYLRGVITKQEFNSIIDTCSKLTAKVYTYNRLKDVEGVSWSKVLALGLTTFLLILYVFLLYFGISR